MRRRSRALLVAVTLTARVLVTQRAVPRPVDSERLRVVTVDASPLAVKRALRRYDARSHKYCGAVVAKAHRRHERNQDGLGAQVLSGPAGAITARARADGSRRRAADGRRAVVWVSLFEGQAEAQDLLFSQRLRLGGLRRRRARSAQGKARGADQTKTISGKLVGAADDV